MISYSTELPTNLHVLTMFEEQHPEELRWGSDIKLENYYNQNSHYIWLLKDGEVVGEVILGWDIFYVGDSLLRSGIVDVNSFTILPEFRGQGLGKMIMTEALKYCKEQEFGEVIAACRQGASIKTFLSLGATITDIHKNWGGCGEDYVGVSILLKNENL